MNVIKWIAVGIVLFAVFTPLSCAFSASGGGFEVEVGSIGGLGVRASAGDYTVHSTGLSTAPVGGAGGDYDVDIGFIYAVYTLAERSPTTPPSTGRVDRGRGPASIGGGGEAETEEEEEETETEEEEEETETVEEEEAERPGQLFDISLSLAESIISSSDELSTLITFESFGTEPTTVSLTFIILDSAGNEIHREEDSITVITEEILRKTFKGLELPDGKYTFVLQTLYNVDVFDEFKQEFEIKKPLLATPLERTLLLGSTAIIVTLLITIAIIKRKKIIGLIKGEQPRRGGKMPETKITN